jgi:hypothetical protein
MADFAWRLEGKAESCPKCGGVNALVTDKTGTHCVVCRWVQPKAEDLTDELAAVARLRQEAEDFGNYIDPVWGIPLKVLQERLRERGLVGGEEATSDQDNANQ